MTNRSTTKLDEAKTADAVDVSATAAPGESDDLEAACGLSEMRAQLAHLRAGEVAPVIAWLAAEIEIAVAGVALARELSVGQDPV